VFRHCEGKDSSETIRYTYQANFNQHQENSDKPKSWLWFIQCQMYLYCTAALFNRCARCTLGCTKICVGCTT